MDAALGKHVPLTTGERIYFPQWAGLPPDVDKQLQFVSGRVQQSGFSEIMYGGSGDTESGWALSQLADQGRIRLEQPITHMRLLFNIWAKKVLSMVDSFGKDRAFFIYGHTKRAHFQEYIKASDLQGYKVECEMDPLFASERVRDHAMATQVRGVLSDETIIEKYLKIDQPQDEIERRLLEQAMDHPAMQQFMILQILQQRSKEGNTAAAMAFELLKKQLLPSLAGANNADTANPEQLTGLQTPTGNAPASAASTVRPGSSTSDALQEMSGAAPNLKGSVE